MIASSAVAAVYRPTSKTIVVFVDDGKGHGQCLLSVHEARALHGVLGGALRIADCHDEPLEAVPA